MRPRIVCAPPIPRVANGGMTNGRHLGATSGVGAEQRCSGTLSNATVAPSLDKLASHHKLAGVNVAPSLNCMQRHCAHTTLQTLMRWQHKRKKQSSRLPQPSRHRRPRGRLPQRGAKAGQRAVRPLQPMARQARLMPRAQRPPASDCHCVNHSVNPAESLSLRPLSSIPVHAFMH